MSLLFGVFVEYEKDKKWHRTTEFGILQWHGVAMTNSSQKVVPLKVMTILGTRPEIIRLASVMRRLDEICTHIMVHTGQNYDYELSQAFFNDFGLRKPDHYLGIDTTSLGSAIGGIIIQSEKILKVEKPNAVLILGDTNSAISAYIARRMKIPVYHMEAGNRSYDRNVPEETNRVLVDHIADFNRCIQSMRGETSSPRGCQQGEYT